MWGTLTPHSQTWSPGPKRWTSKPLAAREEWLVSMASALAKSSGSVTLKARSSPGVTATFSPAASAMPSSSVAPGGGGAVGGEQGGVAEGLGRLDAPQAFAVDGAFVERCRRGAGCR